MYTNVRAGMPNHVLRDEEKGPLRRVQSGTMVANRAMEALDNLVSEERVRPDDIDGGFEFNAW